MTPFITAEHLHVLLNHVPLIGLAFAGIPLLFALITRQRPALWVGLIMVLVSVAALPIVMESGEEAFERFVEGEVPGGLDAGGQAWMADHEERAERAAVLIYITAAAALAGMGILWKWPRAERAVAAVMLALCAISIAAMTWVAAAGGRIRHPEFRPPDQPVTLGERSRGTWGDRVREQDSRKRRLPSGA